MESIRPRTWSTITPASVQMYPSLAELLAAYSYTDIPGEIVEELRHRYDAHGLEYTSYDFHPPDGRIINACMGHNSILEAREELTDAIFNLLVLNLKGESWQAKSALAYTLHAWMVLSPRSASGTS